MFSKLLITLLVVGGIAFGLYQAGLLDSILAGENKDPNTENNNNNNNSNKNNKDVISVGVVTWGGYAGGQYFNEGFEANTKSRFYKDYGFKVDFKILDDFVASRKAFENNDVQLLWCTVDAFPTESGSLSGDPQVVFQADWSRGGDAVVVRRGITKVSDLKGKKIAVAELTPSHSFLIWLLEAGGLTIDDVEIVTQPNAIDAAATFKSKQVDAAVVWSPDDVACVESVPGAKVLESSRNASHIIADVFIAKKDYINNNKEQLQQLYEGWMKGAAEINKSDQAKRKAAKILSANFDGFSEDDTYAAINNVRLTTHGDNLAFFGMDNNYKNVTGEDLYNSMKLKYSKYGYKEVNAAPNWRLVSNAVAVKNTTLAGPEHKSEGAKDFTPVTDKDVKRPAIATKAVSINFGTGEYKLSENAKYIIDNEFVDIARSFSNSRIRVEGNTDNVGSASSNISLSKKRAQSVVEYLIREHKMPRNRFIVVGNGPNKPIASNNTSDGKAKNRRTDFELVAE